MDVNLCARLFSPIRIMEGERKKENCKAEKHRILPLRESYMSIPAAASDEFTVPTSNIERCRKLIRLRVQFFFLFYFLELLMSFGRPPSINVGFKVTPPDRGSFPLDHYGAQSLRNQMFCCSIS